MTKTELLETYTAEQLAEMVVNLQNDIKLKVVKSGYPVNGDVLKCKCDKCGNEFIAVLDSDYELIKKHDWRKRKGENMNISDIQKCQEEYEKLLKESPLESTINKISRDILEQKNNAMAMEFTRIICDLLKRYGVHVHCKETKLSENITHNSIEEQYKIVFDSVDFSQHDKEFTDKIEELQSQVEKYCKALEDAKKERDCQIAEFQSRTEKDKTELERAKTTINQIDDILEKLFGARHDTVDKPDEFEKILKQKVENYNTIADYLCDEPISVAQTLISAKRSYELSAEEKKRSGLEKGYYHIFDVSELRQIAEHLLIYCDHNGEVEE